MRGHYNKVDLSRATYPDIVKLLTENIFCLKSMNNKLKPTIDYKYFGGDNYKEFNFLAYGLNEARKELKRFIGVDPLVEKENVIKEHIEAHGANLIDINYYTDKNGEKYSGYTMDFNEEGSMTVKPYLVYKKDGEFELVSSFTHWIDELVEFVRTGRVKDLHSKLCYYRIGNEFYDKDKYFVLDGKAYAKKDYALEDGKVIDLKKCLIINADSRYAYALKNGLHNFERKYYLQAENDEEFVNKPFCDNAFISIIAVRDTTIQGLLSYPFLSTMFLCGKKRYYFGNYPEVQYTKEEVLDLELKPSEQHKKLYHKIEEDVLTVYNKYASVPTDLEDIRSKLTKNIRFYVEIKDKDKGTLGQIFKELFPNGYCFNASELNKRLAIAKKLLLKEKEYARK